MNNKSIILVIFILSLILICNYKLTLKPTKKTFHNKKPNKFENYFNGAYEPNPSKFIIYTCQKECIDETCINGIRCGGLGDRLKASVTAFLWALLTNRTLLININTPCPMQESYESNIVNWYENLNETIFKVKNKSISSLKLKTFYNGYGYILTDVNGKLYTHKLILNNLIDFENNVDVFIYWTHFYRPEILSNSITYHSRLRQLGIEFDPIDGPNLFRTLYRMLFKLKPRIQIQHDLFLKKAKPTENTKLICAQIRLGGRSSNFNDASRISKNANSTQAIWKFIRDNFTSKLLDYKIYVTSDHKEVEIEASDYFGEKNVVFSNGEITHVDLDRLKGKLKSLDECNRYDKTYLDFEILKSCDMGVISQSGFSKLAIYNLEKPSNEIYVYSYNYNQHMFDKFQMADFNFY